MAGLSAAPMTLTSAHGITGEQLSWCRGRRSCACLQLPPPPLSLHEWASAKPPGALPCALCAVNDAAPFPGMVSRRASIDMGSFAKAARVAGASSAAMAAAAGAGGAGAGAGAAPVHGKVAGAWGAGRVAGKGPLPRSTTPLFGPTRVERATSAPGVRVFRMDAYAYAYARACDYFVSASCLSAHAHAHDEPMLTSTAGTLFIDYWRLLFSALPNPQRPEALRNHFFW